MTDRDPCPRCGLIYGHRYPCTEARDYLDIPEFLRVQPKERSDAWKGKRLRWTRDMNFNDKPTKVEEAATRQLRRELEKQKAEKKAERLAALKERFGR